MDCCKSHKEHKEEGAVRKGFSWWWCLLLVPVAAAIIYIFRIPVNSLLPWGVFLLCPLMHVFMMKGHEGHEVLKEYKEEKE